LSRKAVGFAFGDLEVGRGVGRVSGDVDWGKVEEVGESMSPGESLKSAVYSKTSLAPLDCELTPLCG
jgi:hypothetical protein